jgi:hypothetical protein
MMLASYLSGHALELFLRYVGIQITLEFVLGGWVPEHIVERLRMGYIVHDDEGTEPERVLGSSAPMVDVRHRYRGHLLDIPKRGHFGPDLLVRKSRVPRDRNTQDCRAICTVEPENGIVTASCHAADSGWSAGTVLVDELINLAQPSLV